MTVTPTGSPILRVRHITFSTIPWTLISTLYIVVPNDTITYDSATGHGAVGVEFGGTAVSSPSPFGAGIAPGPADEISQQLVAINTDLQWSEASYRGFFTLQVSVDNVTATYYAMKNLSEFSYMRIYRHTR